MASANSASGLCELRRSLSYYLTPTPSETNNPFHPDEPFPGTIIGGPLLTDRNQESAAEQVVCLLHYCSLPGSGREACIGRSGVMPDVAAWSRKQIRWGNGTRVSPVVLLFLQPRLFLYLFFGGTVPLR